MKAISTPEAPAALGPYSQAVRSGRTIYLAGQIGLDPCTMALEVEASEQVRRVFRNIRAICHAAGADLDQMAQLTVYLTDLAIWPVVNEVMREFFAAPFPARTAVGVAALPLGAVVECDAVISLEDTP